MAKDLKIEVADIIQRLNKIEYDYGQEINKKSLFRNAGRKVVKQLRSNAPVDEGNLRDSMAILNFKRDKTAIYAGPRYHSATNSEGERRNAIGPHAHLVEYGFITRSGKRVEGRPFIKQTYNQTKAAVIATLESDVIKLQKRLERKYGK